MSLSRSKTILCLFIIFSFMVPLSDCQGEIKCALTADGTPQDDCEVEEGDTVYLRAEPDSGSERSLIQTVGGPYPAPAQGEPPATNAAEGGRDYSHVATEVNGNWDAIPLKIEDDCEIENQEILFGFIIPESETTPDDVVEITINDNDDEYYLENEYYEVNEDDGSVTFYVCRRSEGALAESEISYSTCDMSAVSGDSGDFTSGTGNINFEADNSDCISETIAISEDEVDEDDEVFGINIAYDDPVSVGCTGRVIEPSKALVTIHNVEAGPEPIVFSFEFYDYAVTEPASGTSQILIKVIRSGDDTAEETVEVNTRGVSASSASDFNNLQTYTVTIDAESSEEEFEITINPDAIVEDPETLEVSLSNPSDGSIGDPSKAVVTIYDVSTTSCCISFESSLYIVKESGTATICLRREGNPEKSGGISVNTEDIDASSGADYTAVSTTLTFDRGDTYMCFDVDTQDDRLKEDTEVIKVSLVELSTSTAIPTCSNEAAQVMIKDDDDEFYLEGNNYKVKESVRQVEIVIVRSGFLGRESSICVSTQSGNDPSCDAQPTSDYRGISNQEIVFGVNQRSHPLRITINEDNVPENEEEFVVVLETCSSNSEGSADHIGFPRKATVYIKNTFTCDTSCGNNGDCVGENTCECLEGYTGAVCDTPVCNPQCVNGDCIDVNICECFSGWSGDDCNTLVTRIAMSITVVEFPLGVPLLWTDDLYDSNSARYRQLRGDIEERNNALYSRILRGFVSYIVVSFLPGSVVVNHEIVVETESDVTVAEVTQSVVDVIDNDNVLGDTQLVLSVEDPLVVPREQPAVQCPFNYCLNGGNCIETQTSYYCSCQTGFSGPRCESVSPDGEPVDTEDLSDGALAAIILGAMAGVLLLFFLGVCWWWNYIGRYRSRIPKPQDAIEQDQVLVNLRPYNGPNPGYDINDGIMGTLPLY